MAAASAHAQSSIRGTVIDSLGAGGPLRGALVVLIERASYASTNELGEFRFDSVPPGHYTVGLLHAVLDSFDLALPLRAIDLPDSASVWIGLATPSAASAFERGCAEQPADAQRAADVVAVLRRRAVCVALAKRAFPATPVDTVAQRTATVQALQPVIVEGNVRRASLMERSGYYDRLRIGLGSFLTPDFMAKHSYSSLATLLQAVPSVRIEYRASGQPVVLFIGTSQVRCVPNFFVDGALVHLSLPILKRSTLRSTSSDADAIAFGDVSAIAPPEDITAIEVYSSAGNIPAQFDYSSSTGCGSVVIWTRSAARR